MKRRVWPYWLPFRENYSSVFSDKCFKITQGEYHLYLFLFFEFLFLWGSIKIACMIQGHPYISVAIVAMGFILDFWLCWFYYKKVD